MDSRDDRDRERVDRDAEVEHVDDVGMGVDGRAGQLSALGLAVAGRAGRGKHSDADVRPRGHE